MNKRLVFYNENDPKAAAWLRELIKAGLIAEGIVDERDIRDIRPDELVGFTQCHFFAGIGGWSLALRLAGWADDRPVWTGSCPCQPFSAAGRGKGVADERHLWPHWFHLVQECQPPIVFGEQVASKDGLGWLDVIQADLEATGYAVGAADLCAAGLGAPHIRQRLWFVAETVGDTNREGPQGRFGVSERASKQPVGPRGLGDGLADVQGAECERPEHTRAGRAGPSNGGDDASGLADHQLQQRSSRTASDNEEGGRDQEPTALAGFCSDSRTGPTNGFWGAADWLHCQDGKWRPVEPGTFPLAHGIPGRVGQLRGYGNAIAPPVAQTFIEACMEI
ncbi:MAG: DNA cytosine methyltransferase [Parvibaculaceae bacterium]|nr:DNA cytosine methyltransferase [Parvibaculaceae bacterium]